MVYSTPNITMFYDNSISNIFVPCIGVRMSEYFWKLPSKRLYPDYYKMIKNPISLLQIRTKIKVVEKKIISPFQNYCYLIFYYFRKVNMALLVKWLVT